MTQKIEVRDIICRSFHGCLREEAAIGGNYRVNVSIAADYSKCLVSDELKDTVDYCQVSLIVQEEMAVRSKLIEHVANRILLRLKKLPHVINVFVEIVKISPPINGEVKEVAVSLSL